MDQARTERLVPSKGEQQKMSPTLITNLFGSILRVGRTFTPPMGTPNGIAELKPVELNGYPQWLLHYGGLVHALDIWEQLSIMLDAREYSIGDCIRWVRLRGMRFSIPRMGDELTGVNLLQEIRELSVPVFFFEGRYDYTAPFVLAEQFYASLHAPYKKLIWFEQSAHTPNMEEPEKFQRELIAIADEFCSEKHPRDTLVAKMKKEQS
jgi:pimeloyl-ACP methyl ester carboxylesterase